MSLTRRWLLGGIGVAVALLLIGWFFVVSPARQTASDIAQEAENVQLDNIRTAARLETLKRQSAEVPAKLAEVEAAKKKMPPEVRQPELVRSIEQQASSAGVDLTGITPSLPVALEGSSTGTIALPMAITATGTYPNIKMFVDNLERQERAFLITSIEVAGSQETGQEYDLSLTGQFYSVPAGSLADTVTPQSEAAPTAQPQAAPSTQARAAANARVAKHDAKAKAAKKHAQANRHHRR